MAAAKLFPCPQCGKRFTPWRAKAYCSELCRKKAQNVRLGYVRRDEATQVAAAPNPETFAQQNRASRRAFRRDEGFEWTACNEVTRKLTRIGAPTAIGWAMNVDGHGWFGRIGGEREFSFGPATQARAKSAVEARLLGEPFDKIDDERTWSGTCWRLLGGSEPHTDTENLTQ